MKKNILLNLRVTPNRAVQIINRLYGSGDINRAKYHKYLSRIQIATDELIAKTAKKQDKLFKKAEQHRFYKKTTDL